MNSKNFKYIKGNTSHWSKVKDHRLCRYFKFFTTLYLFMFDYYDDERNIFVPNVDMVTHPFNEILD